MKSNRVCIDLCCFKFHLGNIRDVAMIDIRHVDLARPSRDVGSISLSGNLTQNLSVQFGPDLLACILDKASASVVGVGNAGPLVNVTQPDGENPHSLLVVDLFRHFDRGACLVFAIREYHEPPYD